MRPEGTRHANASLLAERTHTWQCKGNEYMAEFSDQGGLVPRVGIVHPFPDQRFHLTSQRLAVILPV